MDICLPTFLGQLEYMKVSTLCPEERVLFLFHITLIYKLFSYFSVIFLSRYRHLPACNPISQNWKFIPSNIDPFSIKAWRLISSFVVTILLYFKVHPLAWQTLMISQITRQSCKLPAHSLSFLNLSSSIESCLPSNSAFTIINIATILISSHDSHSKAQLQTVCQELLLQDIGES